MILVGLGVNNQFFLAKTIDFSLLVQQKLSVESSINDEVHQKSTLGHAKTDMFVCIFYIVLGDP